MQFGSVVPHQCHPALQPAGFFLDSFVGFDVIPGDICAGYFQFRFVCFSRWCVGLSS